MLATRTAAFAMRNCDDVYQDGLRTDGVYNVYTGSKFAQVYCEFERENYNNWLVSFPISSKCCTVVRHIALTLSTKTSVNKFSAAKLI